MENKTIKIELEPPLYIGDWNDKNLTEVIQSLRSALDTVPDEHKKNAKVKLSRCGGQFEAPRTYLHIVPM